MLLDSIEGLDRELKADLDRLVLFDHAVELVRLGYHAGFDQCRSADVCYPLADPRGPVLVARSGQEELNSLTMEACVSRLAVFNIVVNLALHGHGSRKRTLLDSGGQGEPVRDGGSNIACPVAAAHEPLLPSVGKTIYQKPSAWVD